MAPLIPVGIPLTLVLGLVVGGQLLHSWNTGYRGPLSVSVIGAAVVTFFWLLSGRQGDQEVRRAIAGSLVVGYLVLVGNGAFWDGPKELSGLADTMISSFTVLVGVVVTAYLGLSAWKGKG